MIVQQVAAEKAAEAQWTNVKKTVDKQRTLEASMKELQKFRNVCSVPSVHLKASLYMLELYFSAWKDPDTRSYSVAASIFQLINEV